MSALDCFVEYWTELMLLDLDGELRIEENSIIDTRLLCEILEGTHASDLRW